MTRVYIKVGGLLVAISMILLGSALVLGQGRNSAVLALSRVWNGYPQIFLLDVDSALALPITRSQTEHLVPTWSPDGSQIAFLYRDTVDFTVAFITPDGRQERLTPGLSFTNVAPLDWSPDSKWVGLVAGRSSNYDLVIVKADDLTSRTLTETPQSEQEIVWSPDSRSIAFTMFVAHTVSDVFVVEIDSSDIRNLSNNDKRSDGTPAWSPDGTQIAYRNGDGLDSEIYVVDLVNDTQRNLSQSPTMDVFAIWLPDGTGIVYGAGEDVSQGELRWIDVETGESHRIAENVSLFTQPALSHDGSRLVYMDTDDVIHIVTRSGDPISTANSVGPMNNVQWSPDGRYVAFVSGSRPGVADGLLALYIIDVRTGQIYNLGPTSGIIYSWRP